MNYFKANMFAAVTQVKRWNLSTVQKLCKASFQFPSPSPNPMYISHNFVLSYFFFHLSCDCKCLLSYRFSPQPSSLVDSLAKYLLMKLGHLSWEFPKVWILLIASACSLVCFSDFPPSQELVVGSQDLRRCWSVCVISCFLGRGVCFSRLVR